MDAADRVETGLHAITQITDTAVDNTIDKSVVNTLYTTVDNTVVNTLDTAVDSTIDKAIEDFWKKKVHISQLVGSSAPWVGGFAMNALQ